MVWALYPFPEVSKIGVRRLYGSFEESLGGGTSRCTFLQESVLQAFTTKVRNLRLKFTVGGEEISGFVPEFRGFTIGDLRLTRLRPILIAKCNFRIDLGI